MPGLHLDELHKFGRWKGLLKGLFDTYGDQARFLVTGRARLDVFKAGGDSLMGRYFGYRMHPLSVAELVVPEADALVRPPAPLGAGTFADLLQFGGYPKPLLRADFRFWRRWSSTRVQQLFKEALQATSWRIYGERGAAKVLRMNPERLRSRMRVYGLRRPKKSS